MSDDKTNSELRDQVSTDLKENQVVAAIRKGLEQVKAGKTRPAREFMEELRRKYEKSR